MVRNTDRENFCFVHRVHNGQCYSISYGSNKLKIFRKISRNEFNDSIEELKSRMIFNSLDDLIASYKLYGKMFNFGVTIERSVEGEDLSVRYVIIVCNHDRKTRNMTSTVCLT